MLMLSKLAASSSTLRVEAVTSLSRPPITPATPMGPPPSVIINMSGARAWSTPSRVVMRSPGKARRTMTAGGPPGLAGLSSS